VLLREHKSLKLALTVDGKKYPVATPLIFFGNNQLQLEDMKLRVAECAAKGKLAGVVVAKSDRISLLKMLWKLVQGKLIKHRTSILFVPNKYRLTVKRPNLLLQSMGN
jgi:diacylglycerol kinase family enzyme